MMKEQKKRLRKEIREEKKRHSADELMAYSSALLEQIEKLQTDTEYIKSAVNGLGQNIQDPSGSRAEALGGAIKSRETTNQRLISFYEKMYDVHVSGHACQEELKLMLNLVKPKYFIPVHGEQKHLYKHSVLAQTMGIPKENIIITGIGNVIELSDNKIALTETVPAGRVLVDGLGVGDVGNIVLRDRQNLAENGIIIVVMTFEKYSNQLLAGPDIVSIGFVYVREAENLLEEARNTVNDAVIDCIDKNITDWGKIKMVVKETLSDYLWKRIKRNPMILPIIMEVE